MSSEHRHSYELHNIIRRQTLASHGPPLDTTYTQGGVLLGSTIEVSDIAVPILLQIYVIDEWIP